MIANEIAESPRLLFLGAGASKPLGKMLMAEFVETLLSIISGEQYSELIKAIWEENRDLEFLIEQLEEIASKRYLGDVHTRRRGDGETYSLPAMSRELGNLATLASRALQRVKHEIYSHYRSIDKSERINLLEEVITRTCGNPGCMVVFTTNYDPSIETLCDSKGW